MITIRQAHIEDAARSRSMMNHARTIDSWRTTYGCLISLILLLAACNSDTSMSFSPNATASSPTSIPSTGGELKGAAPGDHKGRPYMSLHHAPTGSFREYPLPQSHSGLMRPAIDHQGRLWFGEMGHNYLASFDPRTQTFQQMTPPHGHSGIMGVAVAPDDTIWFAEQYANYLGHYFPGTHQFQTFPLPALTIPDPANTGKVLSLPSAPNDIALSHDKSGSYNVWFTELNADSIGRLDPRTGNIRQYPLSPKRSVQTLNPYGITIDALGMIWFTESSNDHIGRLDPSSGKISLFTLPGLAPNTTLMEIASDARGMIWATSFSSSLLLSFNPRTSTFTPYYLPSSANGTSGLYGVTVTTSGEVWVTVAAQNVIARLDVAGNHFIYYHIPTSASFPFGIVMDTNNTLWFTEAGSDKIGMLKL